MCPIWQIHNLVAVLATTTTKYNHLYLFSSTCLTRFIKLRKAKYHTQNFHYLAHRRLEPSSLVEVIIKENIVLQFY